MGLTEYRHGVPLVTAISFGSWLVLSLFTSCFSAMIAYPLPPDTRTGGCDNAFTSALRTLTGDTERKPFYDVIYDVNLSYLRSSALCLQSGISPVGRCYFGIL